MEHKKYNIVLQVKNISQVCILAIVMFEMEIKITSQREGSHFKLQSICKILYVNDSFRAYIIHF